MGIRLHYATKYVVEYSDAASFNHQQEKIAEVLELHNCEIFREGDSPYDDFSVPREDIVRMLGELRGCADRVQCGLQVEDLIAYFDGAVKQAEPNESDIHFFWF